MTPGLFGSGRNGLFLVYDMIDGRKHEQIPGYVRGGMFRTRSYFNVFIVVHVVVVVGSRMVVSVITKALFHHEILVVARVDTIGQTRCTTGTQVQIHVVIAVVDIHRTRHGWSKVVEKGDGEC